MRNSTSSVYSCAVELGGGSAGCTVSIILISGAIGDIVGLSYRGRGICATTNTLIVVISSTGICGVITQSSTGSGTATISKSTIDHCETVVATASTARDISGIVGDVATGIGTD